MGGPMNTAGRRHANVPALYDWQRRGMLRWALLEHYDDDDDFRRDLRTLALPGGDDVDRVAEIAARYGLDRLIADEHHLDGIALLSEWVYWSRQSPGRDLKLCSVAGFGGAVAEMAVEDRIAWDPAREPRPDARDRLVAQVDVLLARGEAGAIEHGYLLLDTAPRLKEHVKWTYLRLRGRTYRQIADVASPAGAYQPRGVAIAVRGMAERIGLTLP